MRCRSTCGALDVVVSVLRMLQHLQPTARPRQVRACVPPVGHSECHRTWPAQSEGAGMLTLYDYLESGNGYKVRLLLSQLGLLFRLVEKDILKGETRTPAFLAINPDGRIPVLQFEDGRTLAQSSAILFYLAEGTPFLPDDRFERAQVLQWMFFEQYSHEPQIAVARFWIHSLHKGKEWADRLQEKWQKGYQALDVMERHL